MLWAISIFKINIMINCWYFFFSIESLKDLIILTWPLYFRSTVALLTKNAWYLRFSNMNWKIMNLKKTFHWIANFWTIVIGHWKNCRWLELRQFKNDSIQSKNFLGLKMPRFFVAYVASDKVRKFQKQKVFWWNWVVLILS